MASVLYLSLHIQHILRWEMIDLHSQLKSYKENFNDGPGNFYFPPPFYLYLDWDPAGKFSDFQQQPGSVQCSAGREIVLWQLLQLTGIKLSDRSRVKNLSQSYFPLFSLPNSPPKSSSVFIFVMLHHIVKVFNQCNGQVGINTHLRYFRKIK